MSPNHAHHPDGHIGYNIRC